MSQFHANSQKAVRLTNIEQGALSTQLVYFQWNPQLHILPMTAQHTCDKRLYEAMCLTNTTCFEINSQTGATTRSPSAANVHVEHDSISTCYRPQHQIKVTGQLRALAA